MERWKRSSLKYQIQDTPVNIGTKNSRRWGKVYKRREGHKTNFDGVTDDFLDSEGEPLSYLLAQWDSNSIDSNEDTNISSDEESHISASVCMKEGGWIFDDKSSHSHEKVKGGAFWFTDAKGKALEGNQHLRFTSSQCSQIDWNAILELTDRLGLKLTPKAQITGIDAVTQ